MIGGFLFRGIERVTIVALLVILAVGVGVPLLNLATPESSAFHIPSYVVPLVGKYLTYALLALAVGLIWGYGGILSLGIAPARVLDTLSTSLGNLNTPAPTSVVAESAH